MAHVEGKTFDSAPSFTYYRVSKYCNLQVCDCLCCSTDFSSKKNSLFAVCCGQNKVLTNKYPATCVMSTDLQGDHVGPGMGLGNLTARDLGGPWYKDRREFNTQITKITEIFTFEKFLFFYLWSRRTAGGQIWCGTRVSCLQCRINGLPTPPNHLM